MMKKKFFYKSYTNIVDKVCDLRRSALTATNKNGMLSKRRQPAVL
jgi:hypothetical protein